MHNLRVTDVLLLGKNPVGKEGGVLRVESRAYVPGGSGDQVSAAATAQVAVVRSGAGMRALERGALALKLARSYDCSKLVWWNTLAACSCCFIAFSYEVCS